MGSEPSGALHHLPPLEPDATDPDALRGSVDGTGMRLAIVCSRYNSDVTSRLLASGRAAAARRGIVEQGLTVVYVPGAFELPLAAKALVDQSANQSAKQTANRSAGQLGSQAGDQLFDAIVLLGSVIRGETSHYDLVAGEAAAGCRAVQLETGVPVIFGVLTTDTLEQALARCGGTHGDKGAEAIDSAIEMVNVLRAIAAIAPAGGRATLRAR